MGNSSDEFDVRALIQSGYRYALALTHHQQDAEDLIQQACLKLLNRRGDLVNRPYLFSAIRTLFIDANRRRSEGSLSDSQQIQIVDSTADHVLQTHQRMDLSVLLQTLRVEEREALYLNCVEGYTAAEIAKLTDQPRGTVLSHLSRAKQRLQQTTAASESMEAP